MGTSCSKTLKAVGCSQLAIVLKGINKEEGIEQEEDSDHSMDTFREHMRRQVGLPDLALLKAEEEEQKRQVLFDRLQDGNDNPAGTRQDPLKLTRQNQVLEKKVVAAASTALETDQAAFALKSCFVQGAPSLEQLSDLHGICGRGRCTREAETSRRQKRLGVCRRRLVLHGLALERNWILAQYSQLYVSIAELKRFRLNGKQPKENLWGKPLAPVDRSQGGLSSDAGGRR